MPPQEDETSSTEGTRPSRRQEFFEEEVDILDPQTLDPADTECPICHEAYSRVSNAGELVVQIHLCDHVFHYKCLNTWLETLGDSNNGTCPMCRKVLYLQSSNPVPSLGMPRDPFEDDRGLVLYHTSILEQAILEGIERQGQTMLVEQSRH